MAKDVSSQDTGKMVAGGQEAQALSRLRRLLFDREVATIDSLGRQVDHLTVTHADMHRQIGEVAASLDATTRDFRGEFTSRAHEVETRLSRIDQRVDEVFDRVGTSEHLRSSVARILDGALKDAEVERHHALAEAVSPLVVNTIKREIVNNRDAMVEALYPITGRLVKTYVANAVKDMMAEINRRLETGMPGRRLMLRLKSIATGRPMAELAFVEAQPFIVEDLFLIDRNNGVLLLHWSADQDESGGFDAAASQGANTDGLLSSYLTAITGFAEEAFKADRASLKTLDLDRYRVFLRASPSFLLAAKCAGAAGRPVEQVIDEAFIRILETQHEAMSRSLTEKTPDGILPETARPELERLLPDLASDLEERIASKQNELERERGGIGSFVILLAILIAPLLGWYGWSSYVGYRTSLVRDAALETMRATPGLAGYPVRIDVARGGGSLALSGLVPSDEVRADFVTRVTARLPGTVVRDELTMLPEGEAFPHDAFARMASDIRTIDRRVTAQAVERALTRTLVSVDNARANLSKLAVALGNASQSDVIKKVDGELVEAQRRLGELVKIDASGMPTGSTDALRAIIPATTRKLAEAHARLVASLSGADSLSSRSPSRISVAQSDPLEALIIAAERLDASTEALLANAKVKEIETNLAVVPSIVQDLNGQIADLRAPIGRLKTLGPTPHEAFIEFATRNAIFFADGVAYRDPDLARKTLGTLAGLLGGNDIIVRVVGFTDATGSSDRNRELGIERARRVANDLMALGVAGTRIVAVGRVDAAAVSADTGISSANRRVGFEVGFQGERTVRP